MREDYYRILDVAPTADKQALREAYRRQAKLYHPDHNADSPEAEERFKLIVEAWHTLGDDERRADYDAWLERRQRYVAMPELAAMRRAQSRVSASHARRRREDRRADKRTVRRVSPFLLRRSSKVGGLAYVLISLCFLSAMVPYFRAHLNAGSHSRTAADAAAKLPPGESPLPPEEQQKNLQNFMRRLVTAAEAGDAVAQFNYGNILYFGNAGVPQDRVAARAWWAKAAEQGHAMAADALRHASPEATEQDALPPQENDEENDE